jgi:hypothetical protein
MSFAALVQFSNALSERPDAKVADVDELRKREGHLMVTSRQSFLPLRRRTSGVFEPLTTASTAFR